MNRSAVSTANEWPNAKPMLDSDMSVSPISAVRREPARAASQPLGTVPNTAPAAYEPERIPALVFDRPKRST